MRSAKSLSTQCRSVIYRAAGMELLETRTYFSQFTAHSRPLGVDVATYQGTINWTTLASQKEFAIIKGTGSDSGNYLDPLFSQNANGARSAGMIFGTYHFAYPDSATSATAQADYMIAHSGIAMENGNLPPMLDLERGSTDPTTISNWVNAFCYELYAKLGVKPIIYTSSGTYAEDVNASVTNTWKFVDANYGTTNGVTYTDTSTAVDTGGPATGNWPTWTIWQYNSKGNVSGIGTEPVDSDVFNGTLAQLQAMEISAQAIVQVGSTTTAGNSSLPYLASGGGTDNSGNAIVENFGSVGQNSTAPTMTFTIENEGTPSVTLGSLTAPSGYTVTGLTSTTLGSLQVETITVTMTTTTAGTHSGNVTFTTNDPSTPTFSIPVTGTVTGLPQITVKNGSTVITNGQSTAISFGSVPADSSAPSFTFTVSNPGGAALTTSGLTVPSGYSITVNLAASIAAGSSSNFTVALSTTNIGTFSGNISFSDNVTGSSPFSFPVTGTITDPTPAAPSNLQFTKVTSSTVTMTWTDNSNDAQSFLIERKTGADGGYNQIGVVQAPTTTYTDPSSGFSPMPGTLYYYRVRAVHGTFDSGYTPEQSVTTLANTPTGISATDGTVPDRVTISWSAATGAAQYQVYRATSANGTQTALGAPVTGTSEDDLNATPGITYYYWVTALNSAAAPTPEDGPDSGFIAADTTPPTIVSGSFDDDYQPMTISFQFSEPVQTLTTANLSVNNTDSNASPTVTGYSYASGTNTATFSLSSGLVDGHYQAVLNGVEDLAGNALSGANALNFSFLTADADGDGTVDSADFAIFAANMGNTSNPKFDQGDFNYDGTVNALDFNALASRYGEMILPAGSSLATASAPADSETAQSLTAARPASGTPAASLFSNQSISSAMDLTDGSESSVLL